MACPHRLRLIISENPGGVWGGYNSGRHSNRHVVENCLTLHINELLRQGAILPGYTCFGSVGWTNASTGQQCASIRYEADLSDTTGPGVRLQYTAKGVPKDYVVRLEATPCPYGGVRWWWVCPMSGLRAAKLHLPPGATVFASRQAYGLAYRSQREVPMDRSHARQRRLYAKLGGEYRYFEQMPPRRPKGMRRTTYERLTAEVFAAIVRHNGIFSAGASRILARPGGGRPSPP